MDVHSPEGAALTPTKRALVEIRQLRAQLAEAKKAWHEPIAIVGMGMRFPGGVHDAESFAKLLWSGGDAVTEIPTDRWSLDAFYAEDPDAVGKMTTRHGAFLEHVDQFDAEFFGISPREAASMDPQQRLMLEVTWEALEDAGHAPSSLDGSRTGIYVGVANNDYGRALFGHTDLIDAYVSTGNAYSVVAGRLSYFLGLQGPSIAIDTACSSSLVALHLACQGLRLGECDLALAGGVNVILTPELNINFSKARMMAPDGRCKTFDAAADGYVRGEGCATVVLRRLSDALADGDRVLAIIRGSAVNQDGRSGGLTAPNGPAQEAVVRGALGVGEIEPGIVSYIETHGTGTPLGDPIEVGALGAVFAKGRDAKHPLIMGSVKSNIGHLEAAAGMAGLIKVVLGLQRQQIPPNLHFKSGNPRIDWAGLPMTVPTAVTSWPAIDGRRVAGISSFGFSGTNAHVIVEEAPDLKPGPTNIPDRPLHLLALSGRHHDSLLDVARQYESRLNGEPAVADTCYTANVGRSHFNHRLAVVGTTASDLRQGLAAYINSTPNSSIALAAGERVIRPRVAFLFTGQGAQHAGMGRLLYDTSPTFRRTLDECAAALAGHLDRGLLDLMFAADSETSPINDTIYAQPVIFAIETALAALWRSWGIEPDFVLGHSLGEYAAAHVAGMLPLDDAIRLVAERGRLTQKIANSGAMAAVLAPIEIVAREIDESGGALTIAAYNGPEHYVLSGPRPAVETALARLESAGVEAKLLRVSYAAHSTLIDPVLPSFERALETIKFNPARVALVSNVTGLLGMEEMVDPKYWLTQMRAPVQFAKSIATLVEQGVTHFVEIGPHPVLLGMGAECVPGAPAEWLPSLRRNRADWCDLLESLQRLYVGGADVDWIGFDRDYRRRRVALPTYPFRRRRHWVDAIGNPAETATIKSLQWPHTIMAIEREADRGPVGVDLSNYPAKWACLERLTNAYSSAVLRKAGIFTRPGDRLTVQEVCNRLGAAEKYQHLLLRWLRRLAGEGQLRVDDEAFVADQPLAIPDLAARWSEAETALFDNEPLLAYIRHCGSLLHEVLAGRVSPIETLFPQGSFELAEGLYEHSSTLRYINGVAAGAVGALVAARDPAKPIRMLEVGAGTGSSTASLLPFLPADRAEYWYTDVTPAFFDRARERFSAFPFLRFGKLDLERDLPEQGFPAGAFDIVFSSNTVHATRDIKASLKRLRALLAPGGTLLLSETTTHFAWLDMTIGLFEGWQHFADDLRSDNPLLPSETWVQVLKDCEYFNAAAFPRPGSPAEDLGVHLIVGRVSEIAADDQNEAAQPVSAPAAVAGPADPKISGFSDRIREAISGERDDLIYEFVLEQVVTVLKLDPSQRPGARHRLLDLGFDSLMAVQLRNRLGAGLSLARPLPATLLFDYPTIEAIKNYILELLFPAVRAPTAKAAAAPILDEASVAAMPDAEIERLLLERLGSA
jgi:acyl transferase domain-containing protein/SAM-dependent methyltransferase